METNYQDDIPHSIAMAAHRGTSFSPEKRAEQEREGYAATLRADFEMLSQHADTDEKKALLETEFSRYREGYKARTLAELHAKSRCVSTMIAGPSGFNVRRAEKSNNAAHRRLEELLEFRKRALAAIVKTLRPELRPIMSGDGDAVERLREKIKAAEESQEAMKKANSAIRANLKKGHDAQLAALVDVGFPEDKARELLKPDCFGGIGFASYSLTNNGANIRRMKERLAHLERAKVTPATVKEGGAARLEDNPGDNRVRLFFPGKPAEEVRARLKRAGFRWTPSMGCWQAYRNTWSLELAAQIAEGKTAQEVA
jgi:hypothetical protein